MTIPFIKTAFSSGEMAPSLYGSVDLQKYGAGLSTCRNCFVSYRGGVKSRAGTAYVGRSMQTGLPNPPRLIPFQFSLQQGYLLEFGNFYMRVVASGGFVTEAAFNVTGATQANPCVVTAASNNFANGDWVFISGAGGMVQIDGQTFIVAGHSGSTFALHDLDGNPIDATAYGAYTSGGTVARIFTLTTPYAAADLPLLKFAQSADVMTLAHPGYPPQQLSRLAAASWTIAAASEIETLSAPTGLSAVPSTTTSTSPASYSYVATAVNGAGSESEASAPATVTNSVNMGATAGSVALQCNPATGAVSYNWYRAPVTFGGAVPAGQIYGFIGSSLAPLFTDTNTVPDFSLSPPMQADPFAPGAVLSITITSGGSGIGNGTQALSITSGTGSGFAGYAVVQGGIAVFAVIQNAGRNYVPGTDTITCAGGGTGFAATFAASPASGTWPGVVSYFQSRRVYASTLNNPDTLFFSRPGDYNNFDVSIPVVDDDAITTTPWAQQVNGVNWLIPMPGGLVVGTGAGAWQVQGPNSFGANQQPITPQNVQAIPQAQNGFGEFLMPIRINYDVVYVQGKGSIVRDLQYNFFYSIYTGTDLTVLSGHLFEGHALIQWAWCEEPYRINWAARDDGILLSLTYLKEQEIWAWARHDTQGQFLSVASVSEPLSGLQGFAAIDAPYFLVQRTIQGENRYYIERMDNRLWFATTDPWCVDCGLSFSGPATANLTGLQHLAGMSVVALADGVAVGPMTVSATGTVTLPFAASNVKIGLSFLPQIQTLYLDTGQPTIQGRRKSIYAVTLRVNASCRLQVGTNQPDGAAQNPPVVGTNWAMTAVPDLGAPFTTAGGGAGVTLYTGDLRAVVNSNWLKPGQIAVQQTNPLPMDIVDIVPEILPGDMPEATVAPPQQGGRNGAPQERSMAA